MARILFSANPLYGHVLPLVPLARAAIGKGHDVAVLSGREVAGVIPPARLLVIPPGKRELTREVARRTGGGNAGTDPTPALAAELFAGARVDLAADRALSAAREFGPQLVVSESADFVGPLVAAVRGIPWAQVAVTTQLPGPMAQAMATAASRRYAQRGVSMTSRVMLVDPVPDCLQPAGFRAAPDRVQVRTECPALGGELLGWPPPPCTVPALEGRVLVTLGTAASSPELISGLLAALAQTGTAMTVVHGPGGVPPGCQDNDSVRHVGFVSLDLLTRGADAVVAAGGLGTILSTLRHGVPLVLLPQIADQHWNAARAAELGCAVSVPGPEQVPAAVTQVLDDPGFRAAARKLGDEIAGFPDADTALDSILAAVA
jgi:UDP:flavonoid glycosyltransferase YjiC (YdhE family)